MEFPKFKQGEHMMIRSTLMISTMLAGGLLLATGARAAEPQPVWQAKGLDAPESALADPGAGVIYVSNINGNPMDADGNGYIAKLSMDGKILDQHWVTGLNAPTGLALHEGLLYAADIDKLAVVDTASGARSSRPTMRQAPNS
jgi:hypothetical protein